MSIKHAPTFKIELELMADGFQRIVGVDEAGCGALAGPVVAGAVIFPLDSNLEKVRDSKLLTERAREELYPQITECATAWGSGSASVEEIFDIGIRAATYLAMRRAVEAIEQPDYILVDAWTIPGINTPQRGIIRGDRTVKSIAAASIIAKVTRDRLMKVYADEYPVYQFGVHKGYGTKVHREAITAHGPCKIHRLGYKTFSSFRT